MLFGFLQVLSKIEFIKYLPLLEIITTVTKVNGLILSSFALFSYFVVIVCFLSFRERKESSIVSENNGAVYLCSLYKTCKSDSSGHSTVTEY